MGNPIQLRLTGTPYQNVSQEFQQRYQQAASDQHIDAAEIDDLRSLSQQTDQSDDQQIVADLAVLTQNNAVVRQRIGHQSEPTTVTFGEGQLNSASLQIGEVSFENVSGTFSATVLELSRDGLFDQADLKTLESSTNRFNDAENYIYNNLTTLVATQSSTALTIDRSNDVFNPIKVQFNPHASDPTTPEAPESPEAPPPKPREFAIAFSAGISSTQTESNRQDGQSLSQGYGYSSLSVAGAYQLSGGKGWLGPIQAYAAFGVSFSQLGSLSQTQTAWAAGVSIGLTDNTAGYIQVSGGNNNTPTGIGVGLLRTFGGPGGDQAVKMPAPQETEPEEANR